MGFFDSLLKTLGVKKGDVSEAAPGGDQPVAEEPSATEGETVSDEEETKEEPPAQGV